MKRKRKKKSKEKNRDTKDTVMLNGNEGVEAERIKEDNEEKRKRKSQKEMYMYMKRIQCVLYPVASCNERPGAPGRPQIFLSIRNISHFGSFLLYFIINTTLTGLSVLIGKIHDV